MTRQEGAVAAQANKGDATAGKEPQRSVDEIEADLVATRQRLVTTVAELKERLSPARANARVQQRAREVYLGEEGVRWERVAYTVAAVGAGIVAMGLANRAVHWVLAFPHRHDEPIDVVYIPVPRAQLEALKLPIPQG